MIGKHKKLLLTALLSIGLFSIHLYAQTTIKGVVISASDNKPVEGATVIVKGSEKGTQTNASGQFTVTGKTGDQMTISSIGFSSQVIIIKNADAP